jgi:hypothetical protein
MSWRLTGSESAMAITGKHYEKILMPAVLSLIALFRSLGSLEPSVTWVSQNKMTNRGIIVEPCFWELSTKPQSNEGSATCGFRSSPLASETDWDDLGKQNRRWVGGLQSHTRKTGWADSLYLIIILCDWHGGAWHANNIQLPENHSSSHGQFCLPLENCM